jgi:broad specificity phosphatase PhoE
VLFVRQATTPGTRSACFPDDQAADPASLATAARLGASLGPATDGFPGSAGAAMVAPVAAARQTAEAMGLVPVEVAALREADPGRWRGLPYEEVARREPDALARWLADPHAAPHGGESRAALHARVARWLDGLPAEVAPSASGSAPTSVDAVLSVGGAVTGRPPRVVVCDVGVLRAALAHVLGLDVLRAARIDLAPLSTTELTAATGGWRVAHVNRKVRS